MSRAATHRGTCQCCGSLQKLPYGLLSKHGYTRPDGWFMGVCPGAEELPFEQSCELVEGYLRRAQARLSELHEARAALERPDNTLGVQSAARIYLGGYAKGKQYQWVDVTLVEEPGTWWDGRPRTLVICEYVCPKTGQAVRRDFSDMGHGTARSAAEAQAQLNKTRLFHLGQQIKELEGYVAWQEKRVRDWTPQPLKPLK